MRHDRTGEEIDDDTEPEPGHSPHCKGWLGYDNKGRLIPCLVCRKHLRDGIVKLNYYDRKNHD